MRKTGFFVLLSLMIAMVLAGCATVPKGTIWYNGDWNWSSLKWVSATHLEGDVPRTTLERKDAVLIFQ